uniref:Uncharacterized protein n=1 Tax=Molossus molossus TaxID=27622 RepID=A0A7J8F6F9_MOLMO|nr:hypothetical protein HJG59_001788 [Molossus molossus]
MFHLRAFLLADHSLYPAPLATPSHHPGLQEPTLLFHARQELHTEPKPGGRPVSGLVTKNVHPV